MNVTSTTFEPFAHTCGSRSANVVFIGEAWGQTEDDLGGVPLAGATGREFARMLLESGWDDSRALLRLAESARSTREFVALREEWLLAHDILLTNVFALRPTNNNLAYLCAKRDEAGNDLTPVRSEDPRYVRSEFLPHLARLASEIAICQPNLIVPLGGTALWALTGSHAIGGARGAVTEIRHNAPIVPYERFGPGRKVLPTYHPAAIFRAWHWRPIVLADLIKALREREFSDIRRPKRTVVVNPSIDDVRQWTMDTLASARMLSPDIETMNGQIRCIGFARSAHEALVVPFIRDLKGTSYWPDPSDEFRAWCCVRDLLASPLPKIFQNGLFDLQYLIRAGLNVRNVRHDSMLLHHAIYPEMQKSLGFLGSVYTNEAPWKTMRLHKGKEELKRDE